MTTTKTPAIACLCCKKVLDATTGVTGDVPTRGDVTVCAYCGKLYEFGEKLSLIPREVDELSDKTFPPEQKALIRSLQAKIMFASAAKVLNR